MSVNGIAYDWESVTIEMPHGVAIGIEEINYNDSREIEEIYGKGSKVRQYGRKNYSASGSMTLTRDEFEAFRKAADGSAYKAKPFPIVSSYANDDMETVTDTLPDVKITKQDTSAKQDDASTGKVKLDFKILSPIKWNGEAAL